MKNKRTLLEKLLNEEIDPDIKTGMDRVIGKEVDNIIGSLSILRKAFNKMIKSKRNIEDFRENGLNYRSPKVLNNAEDYLDDINNTILKEFINIFYTFKDEKQFKNGNYEVVAKRIKKAIYNINKLK